MQASWCFRRTPMNQATTVSPLLARAICGRTTRRSTTRCPMAQTQLYRDLRIDIDPVADQPNLTVANAGATTLFANSWESAPNSDTTSEPVSGATFEGWTLITAPDSQSGGSDAFEVSAQGDFQQRQDGGFAAVLPNPGTDPSTSNEQCIGQGYPARRWVSRAASVRWRDRLRFLVRVCRREGFGTTYTQIGIYVDGVLAAQYSATSPQDYIDWKQLHYSILGDGGDPHHQYPDRRNSIHFGRPRRIHRRTVDGRYQGVIAGNAGGGSTRVRWPAMCLRLWSIPMAPRLSD